MKITRLDLDGIGSPRGLAERIHEIEELPLAVPLEELCAALDIVSIRRTETASFEAALITDAVKSSGDILLSINSPPLRQRFSLAHELGHFLIEAHRPREGRPMECQSGDFHMLNSRDKDRGRRIEAEANSFAAHLLMPAKRIRQFLGQHGTSLETLVSIAAQFAVSKEAMARALVEAAHDPVAVILSKNGEVMRFYRHEEFPFLSIAKGEAVIFESVSGGSLQPGVCSEEVEVEPDTWLAEREAEHVLVFTEQSLGQNDGYAMTLLQAELDEQ